MAAVTAAMVKELREMTGAGMMDCKKALAETEGDMDKGVVLNSCRSTFLPDLHHRREHEDQKIYTGGRG